jgi:hypothetical protein
MSVEGPFFVTFMIAGRPRKQPTPDHEHWSMDDLKDGFWVTNEHILCRANQGQYWIPPSQLVLIEKRNQTPTSL